MTPLITALYPEARAPALVMFDLDGTLVDSAPDLVLAVDTMLVGLDRPPAGEDKVRAWIGNGAATLVRRALADSADPECVAQVDERLWSDAQQRFRDAYTAVNGQASVLYPGVGEVLSAWLARGIALAIVTNKPRVFAIPLLEQLGIGDAFTAVIGGECLPDKKPHPLPLQHVMAMLGQGPATSLMVGDSRNDVDAARAAGVPVICRREGYNHGEDIALSMPDALFSSFFELL